MGEIFYDGKHSIIFEKELLDEKKDTYKDFHLAPTSRPVINPPKQKTNYIDVPGMNGHIDASDILTGYPVFENRTGSLSFYVINGCEDWYTIYNKLLEFFHGRNMTFRLTDEPDYFYKGKMAVNKWESKKDNSEITLDYSVEPYKWAVLETIDDWLWDTFDFEEGIIGTDLFRDVSFDTTEYQKVEIDPWFIGSAPVCPVIRVTSISDTVATTLMTTMNLLGSGNDNEEEEEVTVVDPPIIGPGGENPDPTDPDPTTDPTTDPDPTDPTTDPTEPTDPDQNTDPDPVTDPTETDDTVGLKCKIVNKVMNYTFEHDLIVGDNQFPDVVFHRDDFEFYIKGSGVLSIIFRKGIL